MVDPPARRSAARAAAAPTSDADLVDQLTDRLNRLGPRNADPEHFHAERNAIAVELRRLARRLRGAEGRAPTTTWRP
jgi:hypothetical protein